MRNSWMRQIASILPAPFLEKEYTPVRQSQPEENLESIPTATKPRPRWGRVCMLCIFCLIGLFFLPKKWLQSTGKGRPKLMDTTQTADFNMSQDCSRDFSRQGQKVSIVCHYNRAKVRGLALQHQQSKTIEAAIKEYIARYKRQPPKGFEQWFEYSQKIGSSLIDDYDQIEATLKPFRALTPAQMQAALNRVTGRKDPLDTFQIRSGKVHFPGNPKDGYIISMHSVLDPIAKYLPDMEFVLNWGDREAVKGKEAPAGVGPENPKETSDISHSDGWTFFTSACPHLYLAQSSLITRPEINLCQNLNNNALIEARGDMQQEVVGISTLVPIMSWAKFSTSRDLLVPHWALSDPNFRGWNKAVDSIPYEEKKKDLYWRGSTTGPSVSKEKWRHNYRVRVVQYLKDLKALLNDVHKVDQSASVQFHSARLEDNDANRKTIRDGLSSDNFNVHFSRLSQCGDDHTGCDILAQSIGLAKGEDASEEHNHQFLLDLDGNSMSARYYRLLQSNGLVFKQTLLGEWHDDRLIPWFHYVPLTYSALGEIPQLIDFFLNEEEGKKVAKSIAAEGRKAAETTLRLEDLSQYWYRLLLEYHSLFPPK